VNVDSAAKRSFKNRLYAEFARIGKALGSPQRLEILEVHAQGERTVESVATETSLSVANVSRHLQQLRQAQLVASRREGLFVHCRLSGPDVPAVMVALRHTAEGHLAEVDRVVSDFLGDRDELTPLTSGELARRIGDDELPADKDYVAYCRGPYCVYADEAVALLRANGRTAQRLSEGFPEWKLAGRPVRTAS
jgi:DNA-binding transcriptional ArsR family regulator